jgi:two-component system OmpR family sensor kinase
LRGPRSLQGRIAAWSGAVFFLLYATACGLVLAIDARNHRSQLQVLLYAQAESLATYYASSHSLDYPELRTLETGQAVPIWMRVIHDGRVIAATPGLPSLPVLARRPEQLGRLAILQDHHPHLAVVPHEVWNQPGTVVEAIASLEGMEARQRDILFALGTTGLLLIPLAALGGRLLAAQALRPLEDLVASIRSLSSEALGQRLQAPGAVTEVAQLADEFNHLLDRLQESVETMRRFTADASHELRTPISILRTGMEVALRKDRSGEEYRELLEENLAEIERVQRIVEGLLTLARSPRGDTHEIPLHPVDFSSVVAAAAESIRPLAEERHIVLDLRIAPGVQVRGDVDHLRLMVLNLLDNAVKFTPVGRRVHVRLDKGVETVARFEVRDEGPGVAPQDRPYIFDRFYRGRGTRAVGSAAGGLGLSLVRWVAESHGGQARLVDADIPGAVFEVVIPLVPDSAQAA